MQPDSLLGQPPLFCDRAWPLVKQQAKPMQPFRLVMPSFQLSCACDVLWALLQAIRLEQATEPAQHKCSQNQSQRRA
jgi:hypothetical protein